nr:MAG: ORF1 [TTV-like mini virus]
MPPYRYYYNRRRRNYQYRRRLWNKRRRIRRAFQRRKWRRQRYYRRHKVKRRFKHRKATKITVKQFNPTHINKCKIIGIKCLFQGSTKVLSTNYIQYIYSTVPPHWPGGGGWSIIVFSLTSLFEDWEHLENIWTKSNNGLPLVQYKGCKLKLYQSQDTDYVAVYDRCWPMVDTDLTHPDSAPSRMLLNKNKIVVPSRKTNPRKKPYKTVFIKPPAQMQTKWYFQKDICKLPLFMLRTTSVDLLYPFCNPNCESNNINIPTISTFIFKNLNFVEYGTKGYSPKKKDNTNIDLWLYASEISNLGANLTNSQLKTLIPLKNTKDFQPGNPIQSNTWEDSPKNWGNPFHYDYITGISEQDTYTIYISETNASTIKSKLNSDTTNISVTKLSGPTVYFCRYNPAKDKGDTNKMYLVSTHTDKYPITPPTDSNLIIEGLPLYLQTWSWTDWVKKTKLVPDPDKYRILVIETKMFDPIQPQYIPIDLDFLEGYDPYTPNKDNPHTPHTPGLYNKSNWHPKLLFQRQSIEKIAQSGPAVHRSVNHKYVQAFAKYKFYFKWGGCPKALQKPFEPCLQPKWTTADNLSTRLEITNPITPPETELYSWDWDSDYVKKKAIQRIGRYTETDIKIVSPTGNKNNPQALQKVQEKDQTAEKEEKTIFDKLQQLRHQRLLLELHLQQCLQK